VTHRVLRNALVVVAVAAIAVTAGSHRPTPPPSGVNEAIARAEHLVTGGRAKQAIQVLEDIRRRYPANWRVSQIVMLFWMQHERYVEVSRIGQEMLRNRSYYNQPKPLTDRQAAAIAALTARVLWTSGDEDASAAMYRQAVALDPQNAEAANAVAWDLAEAGEDLSRALVLSQRAVRFSPDNAAYVDTLGWVYFKQKRMRDALPLLSRAVSLNPDEAELREHLAEVKLATGDLPGAYVEIRKSLLLNPSSRIARKTLQTIRRRYSPEGIFF